MMFSDSMRIKIKGEQTLENLSITLQKILYMLEQNEVSKVESCNLYFKAKKESGKEKVFSRIDYPEFEIIPEDPKSSRGGSTRKPNYRRIK